MYSKLFNLIFCCYLACLLLWADVFADKYPGLSERISYLKIVGGRPALPNAWPFFAVIYIHKHGHQNYEQCGGTLIHESWVMTTAYCSTDYSFLYILLGAQNLSDYRATSRYFFSANRTVVHPCYDETEFSGYNLGLIQLDSPAENILPACLPNSPTSDWRQLNMGNYLTNCIALGYGVTNSMRLSDVLQQVSFNNVSRRVCASHFANVSRNYLCALGNNGEDTCGGDEGGPLLCPSQTGLCGSMYVAAVTVAGSSICGRGNIPGLYNAVFPQTRWIRQVIHGLNIGNIFSCSDNNSWYKSNPSG